MFKLATDVKQTHNQVDAGQHSSRCGTSPHIAIIGTGGMAHWHARRFRQIRGVQLCAFCDIDEKRVRQFAAEHEPEATVFTDANPLLRSADIEAVSIVASDAHHAPLALAAPAAGKYVLCEKPLATNYADAKRMVAAAKKAGVVNMVDFSYRNAPAVQKAAQLVGSGKIGDVVHVEASYKQSWLVSKSWGDWRKCHGLLWRLSTTHGSHGVRATLERTSSTSHHTTPASSVRSKHVSKPSIDSKVNATAPTNSTQTTPH